MSDNERFYVWNPQAGPPTRPHEFLDTAVQEAERLARNNPGQSFHVICIMGTSRVQPQGQFVLSPLGESLRGALDAADVVIPF